jgi:hypothetical protein
MTKRERELMKALRIYDACMDELSFYVGHTRPMVGEQAGLRALEVCMEATKAQRILKKYEKESDNG